MKQCKCCGKIYKGIPDAADLFEDATRKDSPTNGYYWECDGEVQFIIGGIIKSQKCNSTLFIPKKQSIPLTEVEK